MFTHNCQNLELIPLTVKLMSMKRMSHLIIHSITLHSKSICSMSFQVISLFIKLSKWKHLVRHIYTNLAPWQNDQTFSYETQELAKGGNSELKNKFSIHFQIIPLHTNFCFFRFILLFLLIILQFKLYIYLPFAQILTKDISMWETLQSFPHGKIN